MAGRPACGHATKTRSPAEWFYAGAWLTPSLAQALLSDLLEFAEVKPLINDLPPSVEVVQRVSKSHRLSFIMNHGKTAATIALPAEAKMLVSDASSSTPDDLPALGMMIMRSAL